MPLARLTHVVVSAPVARGGASACKRTIKYLHGVLQGAWILRPEWIAESLRSCDDVLTRRFPRRKPRLG